MITNRIPGLVGIYAVLLPSMFDDGRYHSVLWCLSVPLMLIGLDQLLRKLDRNLRTAIVVVLCFLCAGRSLLLWRQITRSGIELVQQTHARAADYIAREIPANAQVAAFDIGVIGYRNPSRRIADLGGLTDASYSPYLQKDRVMDYLADKHIRYLVWVSLPDGSSDLPQIMKMTPEIRKQLEPLAFFCANFDDWNIVRYHARCQAVYRVVSR